MELSIKFFSLVYHFVPTLARIFSNPTHIFSTLDFRMGRGIGPGDLRASQMIGAPLGNAVSSPFCLKYLVPLLASVFFSNATVQRIFHSGQSSVRAEVHFLLQCLFRFQTDTVTASFMVGWRFHVATRSIFGSRRRNTSLKYFVHFASCAARRESPNRGTARALFNVEKRDRSCNRFGSRW